MVSSTYNVIRVRNVKGKLFLNVQKMESAYDRITITRRGREVTLWRSRYTGRFVKPSLVAAERGRIKHYNLVNRIRYNGNFASYRDAERYLSDLVDMSRNAPAELRDEVWSSVLSP